MLSSRIGHVRQTLEVNRKGWIFMAYNVRTGEKRTIHSVRFINKYKFLAIFEKYQCAVHWEFIS
jgi:hypothetical protein